MSIFYYWEWEIPRFEHKNNGTAKRLLTNSVELRLPSNIMTRSPEIENIKLFVILKIGNHRDILHHELSRQTAGDVVIQCGDGEVTAYQAVLALVSPFLRGLFCDTTWEQSSAGEVTPSVIIPDTRKQDVVRLLKLLHSGTVTGRTRLFSLI